MVCGHKMESKNMPRMREMTLGAVGGSERTGYVCSFAVAPCGARTLAPDGGFSFLAGFFRDDA